MANTYTTAGLQTALDAVNDAAQGAATKTALKAYVTTYNGILAKGSVEGISVDGFPSPTELIQQLKAIGQLAPTTKRRGRLGVSRG